MILTGNQIKREIESGSIVISPFNADRVEPNSYGFSLGDTILTYEDIEVDPSTAPTAAKQVIGSEGLVLYPGRLYLGATGERMGSTRHASTLHARLSTALLGIWIQYSAPLGHSGAIIPWTLEIKVAHPVRVYAGMLIGKIAFWDMLGDGLEYEGRYSKSSDATASRFWMDLQ